MEEPEIVLGPGGHREVKPGMMTIKIENTKMDITKEDTIPLAVWFGFKVKGKKDTMNLNIRPITGFNVSTAGIISPTPRLGFALGSSQTKT